LTSSEAQVRFEVHLHVTDADVTIRGRLSNSLA
jgi:hypothetical protein